MSKPLILVTNDDGIFAAGIRSLIEFVKPLGDLLVVAPDKPQSAMGHAVTIQTPLRLNLIKTEKGYTEYTCNGTPADCVKLARKVILKSKPDLIVSGINHGSNASVNVLYSGTMAAVIEGAMENIPSVGFSLNELSYEASFHHCESTVQSVSKAILENKLPDGVCLNVNFPRNEGIPLKGIKITRQAKAYWDENFDERKDPHKRDYFWLQGKFVTLETDSENDYAAINQGYVSIVPTQIDLTAYQMINEIKNWNLTY